MIIAGIDEAGYGPLLGPLVVSAAAFELPTVPMTEEPEAVPCLWHLLKSAVAKKAPVRNGRILIADSKVVHNLSDGNKLLERGVLAFLRTMDTNSAADELTASVLLERLGCTNHELTSHPWYAPQDLALPWLTDTGDLAIAANMLRAALGTAQVRTRALRTAVVSERLYNRLVAHTHNKASALVSITLTHLYHLHQDFGHLGLVVGIDKQGGRDHYTSLLLRSFPDAQLKVLHESAESSTYLLHESSPANGAGAGGPRRTLIQFREKGETAFLPTALASMLCKYLRELCMHSFNAWWCNQITGLQPTAGYYQDGTRWLLDVEPHLPRLGIKRDMLVRVR